MTVGVKHLGNSGRQRRLPRLTQKEGFTVHPFDIANGVETSGLIPGRFLKAAHAHDRHSTAYFGVAPSVFHGLLKRWHRTKPCAAIEDFTFLDIGAGMGRAMLLASEYPFREVDGVELNPILAGMACRNIERWQKAGRAVAPMRMTVGDAVELEMSKGPHLVFLFNPFGPMVMKRLLSRLVRLFVRRPGELDILYVNNEQDRVIEKQAGFARVFLGKVRRSREDAIADHRIMANQPDGEYASSNYEDCSIWRWNGK